MTKKDYELFAHEINKIAQTNLSNASTIMALCSKVFEKNNPLFQPDKFERACLEGKHIRTSIKENE